MSDSAAPAVKEEQKLEAAIAADEAPAHVTHKADDPIQPAAPAAAEAGTEAKTDDAAKPTDVEPAAGTSTDAADAAKDAGKKSPSLLARILAPFHKEPKDKEKEHKKEEAKKEEKETKEKEVKAKKEKAPKSPKPKKEKKEKEEKKADEKAEAGPSKAAEETPAVVATETPAPEKAAAAETPIADEHKKDEAKKDGEADAPAAGDEAGAAIPRPKADKTNSAAKIARRVSAKVAGIFVPPKDKKAPAPATEDKKVESNPPQIEEPAKVGPLDTAAPAEAKEAEDKKTEAPPAAPVVAATA